MITYEVNRAELELVEKKLGDMKSKAAQVFKNAVNKTARQARKRIAQSAKGAYTVKQAFFAASGISVYTLFWIPMPGIVGPTYIRFSCFTSSAAACVSVSFTASAVSVFLGIMLRFPPSYLRHVE